MYTRMVQKLVEKLCLKHKLSQKNEHRCSNREQFRGVFCQAAPLLSPDFVISTGRLARGARSPPRPPRQGVLPPLVLPKGRGMEPGAECSRGPGMKGGGMHRATCCRRFNVVSSESGAAPPAAATNGVCKTNLGVSGHGKPESVFLRFCRIRGQISPGFVFFLSQISEATGKQTSQLNG